MGPQRIIAVVDVKFCRVFITGLFHPEVPLAKTDFVGAEDAFGSVDQFLVNGDVFEAGMVPGKEQLFRCVILSIISNVTVVGWGV